MKQWMLSGAARRRRIARRGKLHLLLARRKLHHLLHAGWERTFTYSASLQRLLVRLRPLWQASRQALQPVARHLHDLSTRLESGRRHSEARQAWQLEERGVALVPPVGRWLTVGLFVFVVTFGGFGSWAALAPLSSASIASGTVKVDSNRKTIQHYEGGIIRDILVRDGDQVREGQVLIRLDDVEVRADHDTLRGQLDALAAREARLMAQAEGLEEIAFPEGLVTRGGELEAAMIIEGQKRIFDDQARSLASEIAVWHQRGELYRAQIASHEAHHDALAQQVASLEEEHAAAAQLLERGFERRPRVLDLERQIAGARGEMAANEGRIAALREQIVEADLQIKALREGRARSVSEELREVQTLAHELTQRMHKTDAQVGRKDIVAPQDGTVMNLRYFTPGGVISPGSDVMDIVPAEDKLVVEARVRPLDIDVVRAGLRANVRLVAYKQRTTPSLEGTVTRISADGLTDPRTGELYFLTSIEVPPQELARVPHVVLYPGMPVDVSIVTGERTLLAYLVQPFTDSLAHAFREE